MALAMCSLGFERSGEGHSDEAMAAPRHSGTHGAYKGS